MINVSNLIILKVYRPMNETVRHDVKINLTSRVFDDFRIN